VTPAPAVAAPAPVLSAEQEAAARSLLDQKTAEIRANPPPPTITIAPPVTTPIPAAPAPTVTPAPPVVATPSPLPTTPAPTPVVTTPAPAPRITTPAPTIAVTAPAAAPAPTKPLTPEQEAAARAIVDQKLYEITGVRPGTVTPPPGTATAPSTQLQVNARPAPPSATTKPATTAVPTTAQTTPVVAPTATRSERLSALLQAYKADRITAIEYHSQRAKIIAETQP